MPAPTKGRRLGGSAAHQRLILANLASQLFAHGRIVTTEAKAKRLRPLAEKLITKAKRGDIHARRLVLTTVRDKGVVHTLFTEIAPSLADRDGGYTRITKVGPRKGDNAPMAVIELVKESVEESRKANAKASPRRRRLLLRRRRRPSRLRPPLLLRQRLLLLRLILALQTLLLRSRSLPRRAQQSSSLRKRVNWRTPPRSRSSRAMTPPLRRLPRSANRIRPARAAKRPEQLCRA